ncbi:R53.5-related protein [Haematococcus lacustris]|uniref:Peroxiredoxin-like 2A n=1 Tax=Haematococcus lacustris TaxID=44745 RepID=A0A699YUC9_HAELA|nr:R53.5-related protein [Haematococcus lacustris]
MPELRHVAGAVLRSITGTQILSDKLWATQPALVLVLRRPGCVLCRDEAKRLWQLHEKAEALGISMNCVVHEWREREIEAFAPAYWPGPLYHDVDKAFYKALGGGQVVKGSSLSLLNPFSSTWARIRKAQQQVSEHNLVGEGLIMGGLMVIGKGEAGVLYSHLETDLGVHADHAEVLQAMQAAAKTAGTGPA